MLLTFSSKYKLQTFFPFSPIFCKMPDQYLKEPRTVSRKFLARPQHEGVGAVVRRSIGRYERMANFSSSSLVYIDWSCSNFLEVWHANILIIQFCIDDMLLHWMEVLELNFWIDWFIWVLVRFELKYFDPFLVLDEFSGGGISVFCSVFQLWIKRKMMVSFILFSNNL